MPLDLDRFTSVVSGTIKSGFSVFEQRLKALEERAQIPGERGEKGEKGDRGDIGPAGPQGERGEMGGIGPQGADGSVGPIGPQGEQGPAGKDGTLENLKMVYDGERTVTFMFKDGTPIEGGVIRMPIVLDRGVFKDGMTYEAGDGTTWGGSFYIAQRETSAKPGQPSEDSRAWRLAVKKGADGKEGKAGPEGPQGKSGPQGPMGPRGYGA